jgi:hypothetical protein
MTNQVHDPVFEGFLRAQHRGGTELARQSDLLDLRPIDKDRYIARFLCKGLVRGRGGEVVEASEFHVGIWFPSTYLRHVEPWKILTWLYPLNAWHPNVRPPAICVGPITPGTELVDLLYRCYEIIRYFNWAPHDGLNGEASQWARNHQERFPVDRRPLRRRALDLQVNHEANRT